MIHQELKTHSKNYIVLILTESFLFAIFLAMKDPLAQVALAWIIGFFYTFWGLFSHPHHLRTTRLVLEYALVGLLAIVLLMIVVGNV